MERIGLGGDPYLVGKLFWIFDKDGDGQVDYKELISGFEMIKQNSFEDKLNNFFQLCDKNKNGTIDKKEFTDSIYEYVHD
jgi:Ca2+-binding EF-hand superfamily protein